MASCKDERPSMAKTVALPRTRERLRLQRANRDWPWALLFLGPNLVLFCVFMAYPVFYGLYISFFDYKIVQPARWVGLANYRQFFHDPLMPRLVWQTTYYVAGSLIPLIVLSLLCAVMLNAIARGAYLWRAIYFLPLVTSPVAAAAVWKWLYAKDQGLLNFFLTKAGIERVDWLYNTRWAMPAVILMTIWRLLPFNTILYLAGLQEIPSHLYDAAAVDGASRWRQFRDITIPLITPTTFFVLLITMFGLLFGSFDILQVMTQGGPVQSTNTFIYYIYQTGFMYFRLGYASAQAYILFVIVFLLTVVNWRLQRRWVHY
ncbi:MAG: sugar ABC transporter permease [Chloroflexota bacterium]